MNESDKALAVPMRDKYWEELSPEQKMDRMREVILYLSRDNIAMSAMLVELTRHTHGANGALLTPIKDGRPWANEAQGFALDHTHRIKTQRECEIGRTRFP